MPGRMSAGAARRRGRLLARNDPSAPRMREWPGRPPVAGQSPTVKDHHQGRARRVPASRGRPLTVIFRGQTSAPIERTRESEALDRLDVCARQAQLDAVSTTSRRAAYVQHPAAWNGHERFRRGICRSGNAISDRGDFAGDRPVAWSKCGGQGRGRTADLPLFRRTLVPTELPDLGRAIEHRAQAQPPTRAVLTGFEPATSTLTGWRALRAALQDQACAGSRQPYHPSTGRAVPPTGFEPVPPP